MLRLRMQSPVNLDIWNRSIELAVRVDALYPAKCAHFIAIAIASAYELESHLILTIRLQPVLRGIDAMLNELQQIRRMMYSCQKYKPRQTGRHVPMPK